MIMDRSKHEARRKAKDDRPLAKVEIMTPTKDHTVIKITNHFKIWRGGQAEAREVETTLDDEEVDYLIAMLEYSKIERRNL